MVSSSKSRVLNKLRLCVRVWAFAHIPQKSDHIFAYAVAPTPQAAILAVG